MSTTDPDAVFAALRAADPDVMDRDQLAIVVRQCAQLASWVDAVKVRATRPTTSARRRGPGRGAKGSARTRGR